MQRNVGQRRLYFQDVRALLEEVEDFRAMSPGDIKASRRVILQRLARAKAAMDSMMDARRSVLAEERPFVQPGFDPIFMDLFRLDERVCWAHEKWAHVGVEAEFASLPALLVKSTIHSESKSGEGRLIQAVAEPWVEIVSILRSDPTAAFQIPSAKWEEIIAGAYQKAGFDEVILTPRSGDHGRDIIATKRGLGSMRIFDQVKAYRPGHLVTADDVRALYGVVVAGDASKGFLTTTSDFAPRLRGDILLAPLIPSRIELINGRQLIDRLCTLANLDGSAETRLVRPGELTLAADLRQTTLNKQRKRKR